MREYTNVAALRADVTASGSKFFSPDTLRFFGTKFPDGHVYGGRVFITSEQPPSGEPIYVVRVIEEAKPGEPITIHSVLTDILDSPRNLASAQKIAKFVAARDLPGKFTYDADADLEAAVRTEFGLVKA